MRTYIVPGPKYPDTDGPWTGGHEEGDERYVGTRDEGGQFGWLYEDGTWVMSNHSESFFLEQIEKGIYQ